MPEDSYAESATPPGETREEFLKRVKGSTKPVRDVGEMPPDPPGRFGQPPPGTVRRDRPVPIKDGVPTCAKCGGTQFAARRKTSTKVMFGLASLAGTPKWVECEVCGQKYKRPNA